MIQIVKAQVEDLQDVLTLQKLAYQSEAMLNNDFTIPPLTETLEQLSETFKSVTILKAIEDSTNEIVGAVRGQAKDHNLLIGRLIVHPRMQNRGIGKQLLRQIEAYFPGYRYELFTSEKSLKNLSLYQKEGYRPYRKEQLSERVTIIYLEK
ncbi:GNAT family N-acetyltransferase [Mobilitalea sibirica]|uniref:GNAT family N-acetyltransferase n=1 Tax=Mobilitalea sibirica TaxID=1462919 RepID=A0A8J7KZX9_9FIRM|nr:GNAT family N-acetyltransferase [Mobilitalea sibirica]MBH1941178.1 GNAT family N-acetyltransferase [Mobilitalea sibirica]